MIEYHADDYGMFPAASRRITDCIENGCINGISLMPNGQCFSQCMEILKKECTKPVRLSVHLNLITEKPLCDPGMIPDLVDDNGFFAVTYGKILAASLIPSKRRRYKEQIKTELGKQIDVCLPYMEEQKSVRLDSHRHIHMVPVVFESLQELVDEKDLNVSYIRIIRERFSFYRKIGRFECFRPVNIIKAVLLDYLGMIDRHRCPRLYKKGNANFASILFSGCMTEKNIGLILENITSASGDLLEDTELMLHPGAVLEEDDLALIHDIEDRKYLSDPMRIKEAEACFASAD
ncbi:MAG: ChbG/HpnK family deacetylase [Lachnospiraceae bacterium]|nr:ChbG/HpnK family deacetylase [Lachnospiraceae bacterium]